MSGSDCRPVRYSLASGRYGLDLGHVKLHSEISIVPVTVEANHTSNAGKQLSREALYLAARERNEHVGLEKVKHALSE